MAAVIRQLPDAFDLVGLAAKLVNSLIVAAVAVPLAVLVASAAGFGLARLPRRPRRIVAAITIGAAMIPTTALLVGRFGLFRVARRHRHPAAADGAGAARRVAVPRAVLPVGLPADLARDLRRRAARGDERARPCTGGSPCRWSSRSRWPSPCRASSTCGAPTSSRSCTCPIRAPVHGAPWASAMLADLDPSNQPLLLAGAVIAMAPVVGVFLLVQRRFLAGVTSR